MRHWFEMAGFKCSAGSQCHIKYLGLINKLNVSNSFYVILNFQIFLRDSPLVCIQSKSVSE